MSPAAKHRWLLGALLAVAGWPAGGIAQTTADDRAVSWRLLLPNIAHDQKRIWLFPGRVGHHLLPVAGTLGATSALVALDPTTAPYFRRTSTFEGFNHAFSSRNTTIGTALAPASLYVAGLARHDSKMTGTALLAGEALADTQIVTTFLKAVTHRARPADLRPHANFSDTWFDAKGPALKGGFPSGHTSAAFAVATVISHRYKRHRWVPYAAYGLAGLVGLSRVSSSAHFVSDVAFGGVLGYSISRFAVLRR